MPANNPDLSDAIQAGRDASTRALASWRENARRQEAIAAEEERQRILDETLQAFGTGWEWGWNLKNVAEAIHESMPQDRPNSPPQAVAPWELRLGLSRFYVPPININVSQVYKAGALTAGALRHQSSPKFNTGHRETVITMTLYFPNYESIWGVEDQFLDLNFDSETSRIPDPSSSGHHDIVQSSSDKKIDDFMSTLRGLIAQFKYAPFLPVRNAYLNGVFNITGVVLKDMSVSTVPNFPNCAAVQLVMYKFNHKVYLPMIEHFDQAIHWGRFRSYLGRAADRLAKSSLPIKTWSEYNQIIDSPSDFGSIVPSVRRTSDFINNDPQNRVTGTQRYRRMEFSDLDEFELFFPLHTPHRVDIPSSAIIEDRSDWDPHVVGSWWSRFMQRLGLTVDNNPEARFDEMRRIAEEQGNTRLEDNTGIRALVSWLNNNNLTIEAMSQDNLNRYIEHRIRSVEYGDREEFSAEIRRQWFYYLYRMMLEDPYLASLLAMQDRRARRLTIDEWELPMFPLGLDGDTCKVVGISASIGNIIARHQLQMEDEPTHQHIGGADSRIDISMIFTGPNAREELTRLRVMLDQMSGLARLEQGHGVLGFLGIQSVFASLFGIRYVVPTGFEVDTIPNQPGSYSVNLSFTDFDIFQQKREQLDPSQQAAMAEQFGKRNPFLRIKQMWSAFNAYPDFPLSVHDVDGKLVGHLDPDYYFRSFKVIDDDVVDAAPVRPSDGLWFGGPEAERESGSTPPFQPIIENDQEAGVQRSNEVVDTIGAALPVEFSLPRVEGSNGSDTMRLYPNSTIDMALCQDGQIIEDGVYSATESIAATSGIPSAIPDMSAAAACQNPILLGGDNPANNFYGMASDMQYRDNSGRMIRAFPTYMLWLIDEAGFGYGVRLFDNFYGLQSVIDFSIVQSEDALDDTLVLRVSNLYSKLSTKFQDYLQADGEDAAVAGIINRFTERTHRMLTGLSDDYMIGLDTIDLKPGVRVHLRAGYSANPNKLETVFNGTITEVEQGEILTVVAQSDAMELSALVETEKENAHSGRIDGSLSGLYLSEPRDLMVTLLSEGASRSREFLAWASRGDIFSENRYGIKHFGNMLYTYMNGEERYRNGVRRDTIAAVLAGYDEEREEAALAAGITEEEVYQGTGISYSDFKPGHAIWELLRMGWVNRKASRDVEIFKRNIYPGNGLGIGQYLGGDLAEIGLGVYLSGDLESIMNLRGVEVDLLSRIEHNDVARVDTDHILAQVREAEGQLRHNLPDPSDADYDSAVAQREAVLGELVRLRWQLYNESYIDQRQSGSPLGAYNPEAEVRRQLEAYDWEELTPGILDSFIESVPDTYRLQREVPIDDLDSSGAIQEFRNEIWRASLTEEGLENPHLDAHFRRPIQLGSGDRPESGHGFRNMLEILNITNPQDQDGPFDEIAFRARTYMRTVWDMFETCAALLPNYIVAVRPFEERSTVFYGKPHWLYTSGVVPLTQGVTPQDGVDFIGPDLEAEELYNQIQMIMEQEDRLQSVEGFFNEIDFWDSNNMTDIRASSVLTGSSGFHFDPVNYRGLFPEGAKLAAEVALAAGFGASERSPIDHLVTIVAIAGAESGWDPGLTSRQNSNGTYDHGLFQINDVHLSQISHADMYDPVKAAHWAYTLYSRAGYNFGDWAVHTDWRGSNRVATNNYLRFLDEAREAVDEVLSAYRRRASSDTIQRDPREGSYPDVPTEIFHSDSGYINAPPSGSGSIPTGSEAVPTEIFDEDSNYGWYDWAPGVGDQDVPTQGEVRAEIRIMEDTFIGQTSEEYRSNFFGVIDNSKTIQQVAEIIQEFESSYFYEEGAAEAFMASRLLAGLSEQQKQAVAESVLLPTPTGEPGGKHTTAIDRDGSSISSTDSVGDMFLDFVRGDPYVYGWVVRVANRRMNLWTLSNIAMAISQHLAETFAQNKWQFDEVHTMFSIYCSYGEEAAIEYMKSNLGVGRRYSNIFSSVFNYITDKDWQEQVNSGSVLGMLASSVTNLIRLNLLGMSEGISMSLDMQKRTNVLNRILNDSIYYSAGVDLETHKITHPFLFVADNPFTREYGEPVAEVREPFSKMHLLGSYQHIIHNGVIESFDDVATVITATSNDGEAVTVYLDKGLPAERQVERAVETNLHWDHPTGWFGLRKILRPVQTLRHILRRVSYGRAGDGISSEFAAKRVALYHLKRSLESIYRGEITIIGDPSIRPHDMAYLMDVYSRMYGFVKVRQVVHHMTPEMGFITQITPGLPVHINDPARWSAQARFRASLGAHALREKARRVLNNSEEQVAGLAATYGIDKKDMTLDDLIDIFDDEIQGSLQYTEGVGSILGDWISNAAINPRMPRGVQSWQFSGLDSFRPMRWFREKMLDQHGCYVDFLTKNGRPMDANLSYAQGIAVGQPLGRSLVIGGLRLATIPILGADGSRIIRTQDVIPQIGWREVDSLNSVSKQLNMFHDATLSRARDHAYSGEFLSNFASDVYWVRVVNIVDADTIDVEVWGHAPHGVYQGNRSLSIGSGELGNRIRLYGSDAVEDNFMHQSDHVRQSKLESGDLGVKATEWVKEKMSSPPINNMVAVRVVSPNSRDRYERSLGHVFWNAPEGFEREDRRRYLLEAAGKVPVKAWDSYTIDGKPHTLDWELVVRGFGRVYSNDLRAVQPGRGARG